MHTIFVMIKCELGQTYKTAAMIADHDARAVLRESDRGRFADTAAAAGDEKGLSVQGEHREEWGRQPRQGERADGLRARPLYKNKR